MTKQQDDTSKKTESSDIRESWKKDQQNLHHAFEKIITGMNWSFQDVREMDMGDLSMAAVALHKIIWMRGGQVRYT